MGLLRDTLRALGAPRRLVPILLVSLPLCAAQQSLSRDPLALPLGVLMCVAFALVAPYLWRRFAPAGPPGRAALRLLAYGTCGLVVVGLLGSLLPRLLGVGATFLTGPESLVVSLALFWVGGWGLGRDIELERDPLALLVRDLLEADRAPTWPLARELEIVKSLCDLHRLRRPDTGSVRVTVAPAAGAAGVQSLVLLPLAGVLAHGGEATLDARADGDALVLTLEQVGRARPDAEALTRVRERIASVYADRASVEVSVERDGRARLIVRLPVTADVTPSASTA